MGGNYEKGFEDVMQSKFGKSGLQKGVESSPNRAKICPKSSPKSASEIVINWGQN